MIPAGQEDQNMKEFKRRRTHRTLLALLPLRLVYGPPMVTVATFLQKLRSETSLKLRKTARITYPTCET